MTLKNSAILLLSFILSSCATNGDQGTIAELDKVNVELKDVNIEGGLEKAMQGYQKFLEQTSESDLTPEAIRRLADLKVEKEYGAVLGEEALGSDESSENTQTTSDPKITTKAVSVLDASSGSSKRGGSASGASPIVSSEESEKDFENRSTRQQKSISAAKEEKLQLPKGEAGADLQNAGAEEAIRLYKKLLKKYPMYERNDQVLYQLSRAYEETGQVDEAIQVINRLVKTFPNSRYTDEAEFRRGEYYFTRKKYLDAEDAYEAVLKFGVGTVYYERALYKKGWTFYKQELYDEALILFFTLLDYKVSVGFDFDKTKDDIEKKRIGDTFRVVSLSFSNLGGAESVQEYFRKHGSRGYEDNIYSHLAEFYFSKRRFNDAATTFDTFVKENPFHKKSPHFSMRVIEIYLKGGFPRLVIEAKKQFASTYGIHSEYWSYFNQSEYPEVLGYLKENLIDLGNHYHSLYQKKEFKKDKPKNYTEASHWYREFLKSFPKDEKSAGINYQLADLLLENKDFKHAAIEYERSAYDYPVNEKSSKAAYAAVFAYREYLKKAPIPEIKNVKREIIRTSLRMVDTYPKHEKATIVLGAAADDLYKMRDFVLAVKVGRRLIEEYPQADEKISRGAWLVVAHASYDIEKYSDAELAYIEVLNLTKEGDKSRKPLVDNLAASVYKQGEKAKEKEDYKTAVRHFLRIAELAPSSKIRPTAEYDAAAVLIQVVDLEQAATVLLSFRTSFPGHKLQNDVTKKIAHVYKELRKFTLAAKEFERIATETKDEELIREAMLEAADLYEKAKDTNNSLRIYKQFVVKFPKPLEFALETYYKIAMIYKSNHELSLYRSTLKHIIAVDARAGSERTDRTRYLAAQSSLVIIEPRYEKHIAIRLSSPLKKSLAKKQKSMKSLVASYARLVGYKVADVTAASTFYIAEIYGDFGRALLESEKPKNLSTVELEEFDLMVEEQAYPFEERAISTHEKNIELLTIGIYSPWIDRSIEILAKLIPGRYGKPEASTSYITKIDNYIYLYPRAAREESSTGYIRKLDFYRHTSQNARDKHQKLSTGAAISIQEEVVNGHTDANETLKNIENSGQPEVDSAVPDAGLGQAGDGEADSDPVSAGDAETLNVNAEVPLKKNTLEDAPVELNVEKPILEDNSPATDANEISVTSDPISTGNAGATSENTEVLLRENALEDVPTELNVEKPIPEENLPTTDGNEISVTSDPIGVGNEGATSEKVDVPLKENEFEDAPAEINAEKPIQEESLPTTDASISPATSDSVSIGNTEATNGNVDVPPKENELEDVPTELNVENPIQEENLTTTEASEIPATSTEKVN